MSITKIELVYLKLCEAMEFIDAFSNITYTFRLCTPTFFNMHSIISSTLGFNTLSLSIIFEDLIKIILSSTLLSTFSFRTFS